MSSDSAIRVLLVEDSINDTFLIVRELQRSGLEVEFERVETADYLKEALHGGRWDAIICDCCLPQFNGVSALMVYHQERLDIPFIMVSGIITEGQDLEMVRAGAHDFVLKDNLARLAPAMRRELRAAEERRALAEAGLCPAAGSQPSGHKPRGSDLSAGLLPEEDAEAPRGFNSAN